MVGYWEHGKESFCYQKAGSFLIAEAARSLARWTLRAGPTSVAVLYINNLVQQFSLLLPFAYPLLYLSEV
jgi:hypothetical protein